MKVKFLRDYGKYQEGQVAELSEEKAEDLHQTGVAYPYVEPAPVVKKPKPAPKKK